MKHRLVEFLASEMGFTIFSIEANMPESYRVNEYVLAGRGDPKELLKGMYFWTWNTGFDMQTSTIAAGIVTAFVEKAEPAIWRERGLRGSPRAS